MWSGTPVEWITRVFLAVSLLSFEMQLATWTGLATLWTLVPLNAVLAAALFVWYGRKPRDQAAGDVLEVLRPAWPPLAVLMLAVVMLNVATPLGTADPYHLQRAERIGSRRHPGLRPASSSEVECARLAVRVAPGRRGRNTSPRGIDASAPRGGGSRLLHAHNRRRHAPAGSLVASRVVSAADGSGGVSSVRPGEERSLRGDARAGRVGLAGDHGSASLRQSRLPGPCGSRELRSG